MEKHDSKHTHKITALEFEREVWLTIRNVLGLAFHAYEIMIKMYFQLSTFILFKFIKLKKRDHIHSEVVVLPNQDDIHHADVKICIVNCN